MAPEELAEIGAEGVRPLKRSEYERLVELGLFQDERVELVRGVILKMSPQNAPHAAVVQRLTQILVRILSGRADVRVQLSFAASDDSEPEPDIALVDPGDYDDAHPNRARLIIEVADTSLRKDRRLKAEVYAASGVPEYWVVNLVDRQIEVSSDPVRGTYSRVTTHRLGESIRLVQFPDLEIAVADILR
jgi:Uma2 family endonuclease